MSLNQEPIQTTLRVTGTPSRNHCRDTELQKLSTFLILQNIVFDANFWTMHRTNLWKHLDSSVWCTIRIATLTFSRSRHRSHCSAAYSLFYFQSLTTTQPWLRRRRIAMSFHFMNRILISISTFLTARIRQTAATTCLYKVCVILIGNLNNYDRRTNNHVRNALLQLRPAINKCPSPG